MPEKTARCFDVYEPGYELEPRETQPGGSIAYQPTNTGMKVHPRQASCLDIIQLLITHSIIMTHKYNPPPLPPSNHNLLSTVTRRSFRSPLQLLRLLRRGLLIAVHQRIHKPLDTSGELAPIHPSVISSPPLRKTHTLSCSEHKAPSNQATTGQSRTVFCRVHKRWDRF